LDWSHSWLLMGSTVPAELAITEAELCLMVAVDTPSVSRTE